MMTPDEMLMDAQRVSNELYNSLPYERYSTLSIVMGALMLSRYVYEKEATEDMGSFETFLNMAIQCFEHENNQTIQ